MSTYAVIEKATGQEVTRYAAMAPVEQDWPFATHDHTALPEDGVQEPVLDPSRWRIWVGAFFDRFEPHKLSILADPDPFVQAVIKDASVRKYIDLLERRDELVQVIGLLNAKGHAVVAATVLDAEPTDGEVWHGE